MKNLVCILPTLIVLIGSLANTLRAQSLSDITVDGARPLNEALWAINDRFNQPVIYEEIRYEAAKHLTSGKSIGLRSNQNYPKGGSLSIHLVDNEQNGYSALQTVMAAYKANYPTLGYSVTLNQGIVCVLPEEMENAQGQQKRIKPILSSFISISSALRSVQDTVQLFAATLAAQSGEKVMVLVQPYREQEVTWGANNEPAVNALVRLANEIGPVTIRLLFDPSDKTYYLSLTPLSQISSIKFTNKEANKAPLKSSPFFVKDKQ